MASSVDDNPPELIEEASSAKTAAKDQAKNGETAPETKKSSTNDKQQGQRDANEGPLIAAVAGARAAAGSPAKTEGPRPRYKSIDKLTAIDQTTGKRVQVWAREKSLGSVGGISNGDSFDMDFEMEEPFSDSEDEDENSAAVRARRRSTRPQLKLPMPRRRIRSLSGTVPPTGYRPVWGGPTMCLGCLEFFDLPKDTQKYTTHLLEKHQIVISDIELIVDLKRYVEHWRPRFGGTGKIGDHFPLIKPTEKDPLFGTVENYYLMSEKLKEDAELRERLALRRLEEVLACQQREREDFTFSRQCLFCRYRARGNRSKMVHHLYMIHHLNLGSPENLVYFNEYMDLLKSKLDKNQCLYCEKEFQDHQVLMEHMRKRQHREVNPKNSYYDRFYVINYLELGKRWLEVLAEDFEDNLTTFVDSDDEEEDVAWNEWEEDNVDEEEQWAVVCLFCDLPFQTTDQLLAHSKEEHNFDLKETFAPLEFYDRIKLVNYIRRKSYDRVCFVCGMDDLKSWEALRKHLGEKDHINHHAAHPKERWDKEEFLLPVFENDHLLWTLESVLSPMEGLEEDAAGAAKKKTQPNSGEESSAKPVVVPEDSPVLSSILEEDPDLLDQLK